MIIYANVDTLFPCTVKENEKLEVFELLYIEQYYLIAVFLGGGVGWEYLNVV